MATYSYTLNGTNNNDPLSIYQPDSNNQWRYVFDGLNGTDSLSFDRLPASDFTIYENSTGIHVDSVSGASHMIYVTLKNVETLKFAYGSTVIDLGTYFPTIAISSSSLTLTAGNTATITFALSEASTSFTASDVTVSGGVLSNFSGSGTSYTALFTPTPNSTTNGVVSVANGAFTDAAGNNNADGSDADNRVTMTVNTVPVDTTPPTIAISSNSLTLTAGNTATITFALSEASTSFTASDVTVSGGVLSNFSGSGTSYTALFTPTPNSTTNGVVSVANGAFTDAAGNNNADGSDANNRVTMTVNTVPVDTTPPTIAISSSTTTLSTGSTATITFTLSEASTSFSASDVTVSGGVLSNFSGSGTSYTALFTPTPNSTTNGLVSVANGAFTDAAGNNNADGSDANNTVTMTVNTVLAEKHTVIDTSLKATYSQAASHYVLSFDPLTDDVLITDATLSSNEITKFTAINRIEFDDLSLNLEVRKVATLIPEAALNRITELYVSFFNRVPDGDGMQYWIGQYQSGKTINNIAESFYSAGVFYSEITGYRPDMTREEFIRVVYKNVLGRDEVDQGGMTYWDAHLADGSETKASLVNTILGVAHSAEFSDPANSYHWVQQLLDNKLDLAKMVSVEWGVNYNTPEASISNGMTIAAAVTPDQIDVAVSLVGINVVDSL